MKSSIALRLPLAALLFGFSACSLANPVSSVTSPTLTVATWNAEHLAYPIDSGCKPRTTAEIEAMRTYAASLQADIVALQEVASTEAIAQVFPTTEWQIIMSGRPDSPTFECRGSGLASSQQKVAFAVRNALNVSTVTPLTEVGLNQPGLRYGLAIEVETDAGPLALLNVHMKSGCFVDDYQRQNSDACQTLAKQIPLVDAWVEQQEAAQRPYFLLGDFNHRLSAPYNRFTQTLTTLADGSKASLRNLTADLLGCHPRYPAPIDHIFAGHLPAQLQLATAQSHHYQDMSEAGMLSDHCAISTTFTLTQPNLSNAVKWQTQSKEYPIITEYLYQQGAAHIRQLDNIAEPWAVIMDLDETVLDNSAYQVMIERAGEQYQSSTWNAWVVSEKATLVPGADKFIQAVVDAGGHLVLITNRDKALDAHTWRNLNALQLPLNANNSCLLGRSAQDKVIATDKGIINDKDLRRQHVMQGRADCFRPQQHALPEVWRSPLNIVMQVGDNIEDLSGTTQQNADPETLVPQMGKAILVLPNPMYGSWAHH